MGLLQASTIAHLASVCGSANDRLQRFHQCHARSKLHSRGCADLYKSDETNPRAAKRIYCAAGRTMHHVLQRETLLLQPQCSAHVVGSFKRTVLVEHCANWSIALVDWLGYFCRFGHAQQIPVFVGTPANCLVDMEAGTLENSQANARICKLYPDCSHDIHATFHVVTATRCPIQSYRLCPSNFRADILHIGYVTRHIHSGIWLIDLLFNRCLPAILILLWFKWKSSPIDPINQDVGLPLKVSGNAFLMWWGVLPPLCITLLGLVLGIDLQLQWGTAFAIWLIPVFMQVMRLQQRLIAASQLRSTLGMFVLIQGLLMLYSYESSAFGCCSKHNRWRMFDSPQLAKELNQSVRALIGGKFTIIVGPTTVAGAVSMALPDHPKVLIDNNLKISPWVHPDELKHPGVIELWPPGEGPLDQQHLPSGWGWRLYRSAT